MSLVGACYDSSSESDSESNEKEKTPENPPGVIPNCGDGGKNCVSPTSKESKKIKLPSASAVIKRRISSDQSVFTSKYGKIHEKETKVLEQHVKMVDSTKNVPVNGKINGKAVCWMYRRGRCRLGRKCKMYHDSELRETETIRDTGATSSNSTNSSRMMFQMHKHGYEEDIEDPDDERKKYNKKRFGITDNVVPPQRVIRHLEKLNNEGHTVR